MKCLSVILCISALWATGKAQGITSIPKKATASVTTSAKTKKAKTAFPTSEQERIYKYLTHHLFYLGSSESDYDIESRVYFNEGGNQVKSGVKTGTLQIYIDGSGSSVTGSFDVSRNGVVTVYNVVSRDPIAGQSPAMTGKVIKLSETVYKLTMSASNATEKNYYLITL